jgi:hypothetical protein
MKYFYIILSSMFGISIGVMLSVLISISIIVLYFEN